MAIAISLNPLYNLKIIQSTRGEVVKPRGLQPHAGFLTLILRYCLRMLARLRIFNVTVVNSEVVPRTGAVIIASNHVSVADPVFLWGAFRRSAVAMAMAGLWWVPGVGQAMWLLGHIAVKRGNPKSHKRALERAKYVLVHHGLLFIYPEGRCSPNGTLLPFKSGVAWLAFDTGAPVIPVGIVGSNNVKRLKSWRVHRKMPVRLTFGEPLDPANFTGPQAESDFLTELARRIAALSYQPYPPQS